MPYFMKANKKLLSGMVLSLIFSVVLINAGFGIGFSKSINLYPGQSLDRYFSIQNTMEPTEDLVIKVSIVRGAEYISLPEGDEFSVLAGTTVPVKVIVSIPETAPVGSIYYGEVLFKTLSSSSEGTEGMISFTTGHSKSFEIEVIPNPNVIIPEDVTETDVTETNVMCDKVNKKGKCIGNWKDEKYVKSNSK